MTGDKAPPPSPLCRPPSPPLAAIVETVEVVEVRIVVGRQYPRSPNAVKNAVPPYCCIYYTHDRLGLKGVLQGPEVNASSSLAIDLSKKKL